MIVKDHALWRHRRLLLSIKHHARRSLGHHHMLTIRIDEPTRRKTRRKLVTWRKLVHHHRLLLIFIENARILGKRRAKPDWRPLSM